MEKEAYAQVEAQEEEDEGKVQVNPQKFRQFTKTRSPGNVIYKH